MVYGDCGKEDFCCDGFLSRGVQDLEAIIAKLKQLIHDGAQV
jgi:hypothetical protein